MVQYMDLWVSCLYARCVGLLAIKDPSDGIPELGHLSQAWNSYLACERLCLRCFLESLEVCLTSTGVVSALRTGNGVWYSPMLDRSASAGLGLTGLKVPPDLQKMNRLLGSLSEALAELGSTKFKKP